MDWTQIVALVHVPMLLMFIYGLKWLAKKYGVDVSGEQWFLVRRAVDTGLQYAEQVSGARKKLDNPMTSKEKLELATGLTHKLLDNFKLGHYKKAAVGLIESTLYHYEGKPPVSNVSTTKVVLDLVSQRVFGIALGYTNGVKSAVDF